MSLRIRVAQVDDSEEMRDCSLRAAPNAPPHSIDRFKLILSAWPGLSWVAANDKDEIVGTCLVRLKEEVKNATHAHVSFLFVLTEYQGQGVGRRLLTTSLQSARAQYNVSEVTLHVRTSNAPAIALYTSLKFYTTKMKPRHYDDGGDAFAMNLLLGNDVDT
ncbi:acyl-CoA N-acyltransferase [Imleria badia]|nr:acyl-CoA N-acyltransferase [Imleria badia]